MANTYTEIAFFLGGSAINT